MNCRCGQESWAVLEKNHLKIGICKKHIIETLRSNCNNEKLKMLKNNPRANFIVDIYETEKTVKIDNFKQVNLDEFNFSPF